MAGAQAADKALTSASPLPTSKPAAARTVSPAAATTAPMETTPSPKPALPDFKAAMLDGPSDNAKANNNKVGKLQELAEAGDVKGILSLAYGSNTYAKKHVKLANDALAALGSTHTVGLSQKPNSHPALYGGATADAVAAAAAATKTQAPTPHPAPKQTTEKTKADIAGPAAGSSDWFKLGSN